MSNQPQILTGQPDSEKEKMYNDFLGRVQQIRKAFETYNPTEDQILEAVKTVPGFESLTHGEDFTYYLNNQLTLVAAAQRIVAIGLDFVIGLENYLLNNKDKLDIEVLKNLSEGIHSTTVDFRKFPNAEAVQEAKAESIRTDMQRADDLADSLSRFTASTADINGIMEQVKGDPTKMSALIQVFLRKDAPPMTPEGFAEALRDYKEIMSQAGANIPVTASAKIFAEYAFALQLLTGAVTRDHLDDLLSNVFYVLSGYLSMVMLEAEISGEA